MRGLLSLVFTIVCFTLNSPANSQAGLPSVNAIKSLNCPWLTVPRDEAIQRIEEIFAHGTITVLDPRTDLKVNRVVVEWNGEKVYAIRRRMDRMDMFGEGLSREKTAQMTMNEYVAYLIDRELGTGLVPVTTLGGRVEDESLYSLQFMLNSKSEIGPGNNDIQLFTWMTGAYDRTNHNVLVDQKGRQFPIDHEGMFNFSLVDENDEMPGAISWSIEGRTPIRPSGDFQIALDRLNLDRLRKVLTPYAPSQAIERLLKRIRMIQSRTP